MTQPPWTPEQRSALERRAGELLLDASAGSGKTSVLVERFVRAVLEDGIEVGSILTITFTEKAAAELRDRIRSALRARGAPEQARATEGAFISTIHGFCARLLRSRALAAGLDPAFVVLDRDRSEPLAAAAFETALSDLARLGDPAVQLIADYGTGALRSAVRAVYDQLRSRGELSPRLPAVPVPPGDEPLIILTKAAGRLAAELAAVAEPGTRVLEAIDRVQAALALSSAPEPWPVELDRLRLPGNGAALGSDACAAYGEALEGYRIACAARAAAPVRDLADRLLEAFGRHYAAGKRAVSGLDFEDLELLARDLLEHREDIRREYAERFDRIMVDELQDTNRVQLALIESIGRENLFMVGDAQQSIYRFRHADVELFERRGERLEARGQRATLRTNFRSHPEIVAAVNFGFSSALGERFRPLVAGRASETPAAPAARGEEPRVELLLVDKGAEWELEGLATPWRLAEARLLAARVAALVAAGTRPGDVVLLLRASTDMRAYERALERAGLPTYVIGGRGYWSHPQVLDLLAYLAVLANPLDETALFGVLASPLAGVSLDALVILAAAARESGRDSWSLLNAPGLADLPALEAVPAHERQALERFASWAAAERATMARYGVDELIERALRHSGYDLTMLAMPGGQRRLANVRKLTRLGAEWQSEHGPGLRAFLAYAEERAAGRAGGSREGEAPVEGEGLDAVRLMTIHRAKGLEFPVVCVADLGRSARPPFEIVRVGGDGRLGLRLSRSGAPGRVSALAFDELGREDREAEEAEERRLFYVAMTRAQERLILSGATRFDGWTTGGARGGGPVAWIAPAFVPGLAARIAEGGGVVGNGAGRVSLVLAADPTGPESPAAPESTALPEPPPPPPAPESTALPEPPSPPAAPGSTALPEPPAPSGPPVTTLSYSALHQYRRCAYRFYAERVLGLPIREDSGQAAPGEPDHDRPDERRGRAERGILIHALLERLNFRRPLGPDAPAVLATAAELGLAAPPSDSEAEEIAALLGAFAAGALCRRLGQALDTQREQPFAYPLREGVLIAGAIDVLAREPGQRTLIVDYKSDQLAGASPGAIVERTYAEQRLIYALAALRTGVRMVEVAYCFLERPEAIVSEIYDRDRRGELEARLGALAAGVLERRFPVSETPHRGLCRGCPAEDGLCSWPLAMTRRGTSDCLF